MRPDSYSRAALARLYTGQRVRVVRGWIDRGDRFESVTLLSPYPDATLTRLVSGTMIIRWTQRSAIMPVQVTMNVRNKRAPLACLLVLCASRVATAQMAPAEPIVLAGGVLTVGGDVSATIGSEDPGFFNYTDYEDSVLQMLRLDLTASVRAGKHLSLLGELRSQNVRTLGVYALYVRVRPWAERRFDIQVGLIPPTFGAFPRRSYEVDNPLIGYPLGYQYLTSCGRTRSRPTRTNWCRCAVADGSPPIRSPMSAAALLACRSPTRSDGTRASRRTPPTTSSN